MALLDELRQQTPALRDYADDDIKRALREQPRFRHLGAEDFERIVSSNPQRPKDESPGFMGGLAAGVDQLQATGGGLMMIAGDKLRSKGLYQAGKGVYDENMAEAAENDLGYGFTDIDSTGKAWEWAKYTAGQQIPMLAASVAGGGAGGVGARMLASQAAKRAAARAGQAMGAYATSTGLEAGAMMGETEDADVSLAHGAIAGGLEAFVPIRMLRSVGKSGIADKAANEIADGVMQEIKRKAGQTTKRAGAGGIFTNALNEMSTEGLQGLINQHATYWVENNGETLLKNLDEVNLKQIMDEAAAGGLMGGMIGGPTGIAERNQARRGLQASEGLRRQREQGQQQAAAPREPSEPVEVDTDAATLGNQIQMARQQSDEDMGGQAQATFEGQTRFTNLRNLYRQAEQSLADGDRERAQRYFDRAEALRSSLSDNLDRSGSRENPVTGDYEPLDRAPRGLLGVDSAPRLGAPDPNVINMGGPTQSRADVTDYEPMATRVRRDERLQEQRQGEQRLRDQVQGQAPQIENQNIIYGQGETAGNANTGLDQPFTNARHTDTQAAMPARPAYQETEATQRRRATSGRQANAYLPDNTPVPVRYRIMDLSEITPSNDPDGRRNPNYPQELQPRDRTGKNSQIQVKNIAARLNPERLEESSDASSGAPIVGPDGVVESGNGRTMAIAQAYQNDGKQARQYRDYLARRAPALGIDPEVVRGMRQPVLVRERSGNIDRAEFARRANEPDVAAMTPHEMAISDADRLSADDLRDWSPDESGDPLAASNNKFIRRFSQRMGNNEASRYRDRSGRANAELGQRMQRALFAKAYSDESGRPADDMVEMVAEQSINLRNLTQALLSAAPDFAIAREYGDVDAQAMVDHVVDAVRVVRQARASGVAVRELVSQTDAFDVPTPPLTRELAMLMANNMRSRKALSDTLGYMAAATRKRAEAAQNGALFNDDVSNEDIVDATTRENDAAPDAGQPDGEGDRPGGDRPGQREPAQGPEDADSQGAAQADVDGEGEFLETYTEQDIADREQAQTARTQAVEAERRQQEQRAQVDREADNFDLTGSDRPADVAMAGGQQDLGSYQEPSTAEAVDRNGIRDEREESNLSSRQRDEGSVRERKKSRAQSISQFDLFAEPVLPVAPKSAKPSIKSDAQDTAKAQVADNFRLRYELAGNDSVPVGLNTITSAEDVAHVVAPFRKRAQENMLALVTDDDGNLLQLIRHSIGNRDSANVYVDELVTSAAMVPGAAKIWLSHNHPSGSDSPSSADYRITSRIRTALDASGMSLEGHVVNATGGRFTYFNDDESARSITPTLVNRKRRLGVAEKVLRKRLPTSHQKIDSPAAARQLVQDMQIEQGLLLLDTQHAPIGVLAMSDAEMQELREGSRARRILKALGSTNAGAVIAVSETRTAANNIAGFINNLSQSGGVRMLDAFVGSAGERKSMAQDRSLETSGTMFFALTGNNRYADSDVPGGAPTAEDVRMALIDHAETLGDFTVVESARELPERLILGMAAQGVNPRNVKGIYSGDKLYIIAGNNNSTEQAVRTAVHEAVGHKGMRGVLGEQLDPVMRQLYKSLPLSKKGKAALEEVLETYTFLDRNNPDDQLTIAEEMVAHLLEKGHRPKAWQRAVAKIRSLLRQMFPSIGWTYTDVLALGEQSREYLRRQEDAKLAAKRTDFSDQSLYSRRGWDEQFPNAALAHPLRWLNDHPDYKAAKAGDDAAALRIARDAVTDEYVEQVRALIPEGAQPRIAPVLAREDAGDNRIPQAAAQVLASRLGLEVSDEAVQVQKVSRTSASALERLGRQPTFDGQVEPGDYILIDDTLTQGGTLAQLKTHIEDQGGRVLAVTALTGKQYSRKLAIDPSIIEQVRDRFGSIENWWRDTFGYGFEGLTQSEARTLLTFDKGRLSPDAVRDRVSAARDEGVWPVDEGATGDRSDPEAPLGDDTRYALSSKRHVPLSEQFNDMDAEMASAFDKITPKTPRRRAVDWYREHAERAATKLRQGMVDRYAALLEIDKAAANDQDIVQNSTASSSWVLARMANAANGALHAMLHNGRVYLDPKEKIIDLKDGDSKGLGSVLGRLGDAAEIERFMGWIAGNRSARLAEEGRENLFTPGEIAALKRANQGTTASGQNRAALYEEVFAEFQQYRDDMLAIAEQSGIISPDQRAMWRDEFYVPFYRLQENEKNPQGPIATSGLSRQQAFKKLKGGSENLNDLLQNTMMNFHHLMEASLKNQAAMQAVDNAEAVGIASVVPESGRDTSNSTFVMRGGEKVFYQIDDPLVFKAITSLAHPGMNSAAMKVMRGFKRLFTNLTTTTPQFMIANLIRDSLQASATSQVSKNALGNVLTGGRYLKDARTHARMMASGASFNFGHLYGDNPDELRAQLTRNMRNAQIIDGPAGVPDAVRRLWSGWNEINNFTENLNRAAIYQQNLDSGKGKLYAAYESRDLIDFSAHGAWPAVRILIDIVPFLNARIQGLDKIYRSGIKPGANVVLEAFGKGKAGVNDKQAAARFWQVTGALAMATMALYAHNQDDEEYQKLEDWERDLYWHVFIGDAHLKIPKPFEVGAISTLTERLLEQAIDDKATGKLFAQRLGHMVTDTFSFSPVPQAFQPALNVYANKDDFTGRPIESLGMDRVSPEFRRRSSTTAVAQGLSNLLNSTVGAVGSPDDNPLALSPVQVDHLIQGYFGQVGAWTAAATDTGWRTLNGETDAAKRWYEYQPVRRFYQNLADEDRYTKYGTLFYEGLNEAQRAYSDVKELRELDELERAVAVADDKRAMLRLRPALNRAQARLRKVNQQMELVRRSNVDGELKRQRLDRLRAVKNQVQKVMGKQVQEARAR
nr:LPD38 domain-containing protein [uncultured Halomonas sp.]